LSKIIDLTHPITSGMGVFPGDPEVSFEQHHAIKDIGYNVTRVCTGTHSGTHIDVPHHCMYSDHTVDKIPLDAVVGWAEVLDLSDKGPNSEITAADLDVYADRVGEGARVLLRTNWSKQWGKESFFSEFPGITEAGAMWLTARKVKLIGLEQPSVHPQKHLEVHKALLSAGMFIVESMTNLDQITADRVYLAALPLKLEGLDGALVRAVALEGVEVSQ